MEIDSNSYVPLRLELRVFAGNPPGYPGLAGAGFMQAASEPSCLKTATDGSCQLNVYQAALLGGIALIIGAAALLGQESTPEFPEFDNY